MKYKAVIFDCDGTLVDSEPAYYHAYKHAMGQKGYEFTHEDHRSFVGIPTALCAQMLSKKIDSDHIESIFEEMEKHYKTLQHAGHTPIHDTVEFLHKLAQEKESLGIKLGLASAADKTTILINLRHLRVEHYFDVILSGKDDLTHYTDPEGVNKPKPYIYEHSAKLLNVAPHECIVIEDSRTGVTAGVDAGCFAVAVPNSYTKHHDLSHAHLTIDTFANLTVQEFFNMVH